MDHFLKNKPLFLHANCALLLELDCEMKWYAPLSLSLEARVSITIR